MCFVNYLNEQEISRKNRSWNVEERSLNDSSIGLHCHPCVSIDYFLRENEHNAVCESFYTDSETRPERKIP